MRYHVEELERTPDQIRYSLEFPATSRFFEGHFPDNPILPGVAQVQICIELLAASLAQPVSVRELESVRFRKPLTPSTPCELTVRLPDADGRIEFAFRSDEGLVADGKMMITTGEASDG